MPQSTRARVLSLHTKQSKRDPPAVIPKSECESVKSWCCARTLRRGDCRSYRKLRGAVVGADDAQYFQGQFGICHGARASETAGIAQDFVVDGYQMFEARASGADAIFLIVAALSDTQRATMK